MVFIKMKQKFLQILLLKLPLLKVRILVLVTLDIKTEMETVFLMRRIELT